MTNSQKEKLICLAIEMGIYVDVISTVKTTTDMVSEAAEILNFEDGVEISQSDVDEVIASIPTEFANYEIDYNRYHEKTLERLANEITVSKKQ